MDTCGEEPVALSSSSQRGHCLQPHPQLHFTNPNEPRHPLWAVLSVDLIWRLLQVSQLSWEAQENLLHEMNLILTFPPAGWGYLLLSPCACSTLAQSHFLIAASARLPAEPKKSPSPGLGPSRRSAQCQHPIGPAGSFASSWSFLGPLTQLKSVSRPLGCEFL